MKKRIYPIIALTCALFAISGCSKTNSLPEKHTISYPDDLETTADDMGADSYNSLLDSTENNYYKVNDYYNMKSDDTLHIISHFETYQQTTEYTCGPACMEMVLHYYGIDDYDELQLAKMAGTNDGIGTTVEGMCQCLDTIGLKYEKHMDTDYKFQSTEEASEYLIQCIDDGIPVMVDWEDWGGHWQIVIGIDTCNSISVDDDVIIFADPYDVTDHYQDGYFTFAFSNFVSMWREGKCANKTIPYEQPYISVIQK